MSISFYAQIEHYFKDFKEKGDVVLHYREKTMREDFAGEYIVRQLEAKNQKPSGTF